MADLFRGYIPSKGKEPLYSVKTWDLLKTPPETGDYVGVLYEDIVQVDFDDEISAKIALGIVKDYNLQCDVLETTRGCHLYFKNDNERIRSQSNKLFNAMGIHSDIGLGSKDRVIPLRITVDIESIRDIDGEEVTVKTKKQITREWIKQKDKLEVIPPYFYPISMKDYDLQRSTTRNQTLYNYILVLQQHNFNREEIRKIIKTVNKYILYEPLDDREIDTITRDEAFRQEMFFDDKTFLHDRFGNYMLTNSHILKIDNQIHIYTSDHLYSNDPKEFEKVMISKIPFLKDNQRKEVYKYIDLKCTKTGEFANPKYIGLKGSILDIQTFERLAYNPSLVINNRIDYEYNPDAYCEVMDKTLNKVCNNDPQIRSLLEEMIGYTLYRKNTMQVCFILTGEGSNGKSTILNVIKRLLGKSNYTSLDLRELEDTFKPAELYNKLANIGDDISAKYLENSSVFKKVVTGESFIVQRKYAQPFELECYATQIFCANELPQVHDKSDGFSRRIVIVPFNAKFSKYDEDYDPFIEDKLLTDESVIYLLKLAINGLRRVLINKSFTKSSVSESEKDDYMRLNNNVLDWFDSDPKFENESATDVYMAYQVWCAQNGCQPVKKLNLGKEIKKKFGFDSIPKYINGKTVRVYGKP